MKESIKNRVLKEAKYILDTKDTIRGTAKKFNVSKSTVHKDLNEKIKKIDSSLIYSLNEIFKEHNASKHIHGGEATKKMYKRGKLWQK